MDSALDPALAALFGALRDPSFIINDEGVIVAANDEAMSILPSARPGEAVDPFISGVAEIKADTKTRVFVRDKLGEDLSMEARISRFPLGDSEARLIVLLPATTLASDVLTSAIDVVPEGFVVFDSDDRLVVCNSAYRRMYATSAPALRPGTAFEDIIRYGLERGQYPEAGQTADSREAWLSTRMRVHRTRQGRVLQQLDNGRWLQIEETRTPSGHTVGVRIDVTDLRKARSSVEALGRIIEAARHEMLVVDRATKRFVMANRGARENLGYSLEELRSMTPLDINPHFDAAKFAEVFEPLLSGEQHRLEFVTEHQRKDGSTYPCALRVEYDPDQGDGVLVAFSEDLTSVIALREAVERKDRELSTLMRNIPDFVLRADAGQKIVYVNPRFAASRDAEPEALLGETLLDMLPEDSRERAAEQISGLRPGDDAALLETTIVGANGERRHIQWSLLGVFVGEAPVEYVCVGRDLTLLHFAQDQLERRAFEAEKADRAKSAFLANVSHEIRTPLNGVLGMAAALEHTRLDATQRQMLSVVTTSGKQLLDILNDILDLSKIEAGEMSMDAVPFAPHTLIDEVVHLFGARARERGLSIMADYGDLRDYQCVGHASRVRQAVTNLVSNAVKFTKAGRVTIGVRVIEKGEPGTDTLEIVVADTGIGVPDDMKEAIFGRFEQGDHTVDKHLGGTGLGLAIVRTICHLHGGGIRVEDNPGGGARFVATFLVRESGGQSGQHDAEPPAQTLANLSRPLKLLIAEDNEMNRTVLSALLSTAPIDIEFAVNGREAVDLLSRERFDAAFVDIRMPVMNGLEVVSIHRAREAAESAPRLPMIACTANVMADQIAHYHEVGFDRYLSKPLVLEQLVECLQWVASGPVSGDSDTGARGSGNSSVRNDVA